MSMTDYVQALLMRPSCQQRLDGRLKQCFQDGMFYLKRPSQTTEALSS